MEGKLYIINQDTGCWEYTGPSGGNGYGQVTLHSASGSVLNKLQAHRVIYELLIGPIPSGNYVCHTCDNPKCINPDHLFLGTPSENMVDKVAKGRHPKPSAKVTQEQVVEIRRLHSQEKLSIATLATQFSVSDQCICKIISRKTWRDVP